MAGALFQGLKSRWGRVLLGVGFAGACAVALAAGVGAAPRNDILGVRFGGDSSETRIVIDLAAAASGQVDNGLPVGRMDVVLKGASAGAGREGSGLGLVRAWRVEDAPGGARLELSLAQQAQVERRFLLPPADGVANYRYVVDIAADGGAPAPPDAAVSRPLRAAYAAPPAHARKVIVLDPGHGGKDSGAVGASSYEKDVTLATALAVKARLERTGRYQVVMTRQSDVFIPLEGRVQIARRVGADLFLSLHADAASDPATHGASVYTLSESGQSRVGYVLGRNEWFLQPAADGNDQAVGQILLDLTQRTTRNRSAAFAQELIAHVGDRAPLLPRSQRDAGYFVLLAPDVPAALLEMGFITNPDDETRLDDPKARAGLADKIAQAIDDYFAGQPAAPSRLASR